ncbi:NAD(P)/FAD-dependent oxidoreductase [Mesobacterium pallidum]|uniref:NAD(P)/FAD-dependent oxidoreductase n=1 Tax=Mesobacterium pallidum TaxID=2872037 RepID=UPI001EE17242|nr:FAD-binding oxidoreductase [Mesobacterium pallidum]
MKRIWEAAAYSADPIRRGWWQRTVVRPRFGALDGNRAAEVVVIGAGVTGLTAARLLAEAGVDVIVLDAEHPGFGASGRSGGFVCLGGARISNRGLESRHGDVARRDWRQAEKAAVDFTAEQIDTLGLKVDRHSEGETLLAHRPRDWESLKAQAQTIRRDYEVQPVLIGREDLAKHGLNGPFHGALTTPIGFAVNPLKYSTGLAKAAEEAGARIFAHSPATAITRGNGWQVSTPKGQVRCRKVIIATNGYSSEDLPDWMAGRYLPLQSSVLVTEPIPKALQAAQGWTSGQMAYDTRRMLHYFRLMPDGRFLFGMRGGLAQTAGAVARNRHAILRDFRKMFPAWAEVETPWYWSGLVCMTMPRTPFVGPVPGAEGLFAGFGYHGNGMAMGGYAGAILADLVQGRAPDRIYPLAMRHRPVSFPLGRFRRALMYPAYALYGVMDL